MTSSLPGHAMKGPRFRRFEVCKPEHEMRHRIVDVTLDLCAQRSNIAIRDPCVPELKTKKHHLFAAIRVKPQSFNALN